MKLDREYQRTLLNKLAEAYPGYGGTYEFLNDATEDEKEKFVANLYYLDEHGLVESGIDLSPYGYSFTHEPRITKDGMDFLAEDGGLSAILGTVTVRLHDETLKALVARKIEESDLPPSDKNRWLEMLRALPVETTKHLAMKLFEMGLSHSPDVLRLLGNYLGFQV